MGRCHLSLASWTTVSIESQNRCQKDLISPFADFVKKLPSRGCRVCHLLSTSGDVLDMITLYVIQYIGVPTPAALNGLRPSHPKVSLLCTKAPAKSSPATSSWKRLPSPFQRSEDGVEVTVRGADGTTTLSHLLKWQYHQYWAALINDTGLPNDVNLVNVDTERPYGVPEEPFIWRLDTHWAPGYHNIKS
ncbi:uncharacterized protein ATNIH1004_001987 [Aspergillus tanneri]|uniref:Uncharacterized protein n=1 Tax=Aspergillus tanneri TaxID=1220188 RepID=A0A5M9M9U9_9EURO|nr:uncharacterized protein ATNIH1004_001987 [Aspergillus tanneri]KAA8641319.1 hypothetical protein ATNIH1004_001987 [Aspergillus tanneri]